MTTRSDGLTRVERQAKARTVPWVVLLAVVGWWGLGAVGCGTKKTPLEVMLPSTGGGGGTDVPGGVSGAVASGGATSSGGTGVAAGVGGATASGGVTSSGGALGSGAAGASGATASGGGATSTGGRGAVTGGTSGGCSSCELHESCWSDSAGARCIARATTVPGRFAVDLTEVTRGQYAAWLATRPSTTGQPAACAWNTTFAPDPTCMAKPSVCAGTSCANHPQACVDLCDATSYCQAIGRDLCSDENWTNACSSDGANPAGYAPTFVRDTCNDYTVGGETTVPVASKPGCRTPAQSTFPGIFDMIGNVAEWADNCTGTAGASDVCKPRGLSFGHGAAAPMCRQSTYADRSATLDNLGFRCCGS